MFWIELLIVMAIIFLGVRKGGTFLAMAGGVGMFILVFILHVKPSDPPITVILIMIAVICASSTLQACGGLDFMVRIAEKVLRKNPKMITIMAPIIAWLFTFMCGTGHIVYSLLPVINEIAIDTGVRPERPISASIVSSQFAITACPLSAATVATLGFIAVSPYASQINLFTLLVVAIPATLIGTVVAALSVLKKGKELSADPEFQRRVAAGEIEDFSKKDHTYKPATKNEKKSVTIFLFAMVAIVLMGALSKVALPKFADHTTLPLTAVIEMFMLVAAAAMVVACKLDSNKMLDMPIFKTGMFAVVLAFGLCWLVNTFIGDQSKFITSNMSALTNQHPWIYILAVFIVGAITTSQSSTTMIMIPIGIALHLPANILIAGWMCANSNFFIPASGQCVAAIAFDSAGTTKIGKFVLNHSYMIPGLVCTAVSVLVAMGLGAIVY
ncbi:MAG TPA: anaerobic C4-dicarboxylate transporter family protein [Oscillospiraceae bacterium]|nr:anaerobic C4-dicarboxylate transporter family protein [Oscillospiraceae bacterium]